MAIRALSRGGGSAVVEAVARRPIGRAEPRNPRRESWSRFPGSWRDPAPHPTLPHRGGKASLTTEGRCLGPESLFPSLRVREGRVRGEGDNCCIIVLDPLRQRAFEATPNSIHEPCVMNRLSAANDTADVVENRGVSWAGKVAMVASPTRKTSKSLLRFW